MAELYRDPSFSPYRLDLFDVGVTAGGGAASDVWEDVVDSEFFPAGSAPVAFDPASITAAAALALAGDHVKRHLDAGTIAAQADLQLVGDHVRRHLAAVTVAAQGAFALIGNHLIGHLAAAVLAGQAALDASSMHAYPKAMPFGAIAAASFLSAPRPRKPRRRYRFRTTGRP